MHNETKVNTNKPRSSRLDEKNVVSDTTNFVGSFETTYGRTYINRGEAEDQLGMRAKQLSSLLLAIQGEGLSHFQRIPDNDQDSILWLARQLSLEIEAMVDIHRADLLGGKA